MSYTDHTCVEIVCDDCRTPYGGDRVAHFPDRGTAARAAISDGEWSVVGEHALCDDCVERCGCVLLGHTWSPWSDPFTVPGGTYTGRVRHCRRCDASEWDSPIPG